MYVLVCRCVYVCTYIYNIIYIVDHINSSALFNSCLSTCVEFCDHCFCIMDIRCCPLLIAYMHACVQSSCLLLAIVSWPWTLQVSLMYFALRSIYEHLHNCVIALFCPSASDMAPRTWKQSMCFITFHLCVFIPTLNITPFKYIADVLQIAHLCMKCAKDWTSIIQIFSSCESSFL